ncbi:nucleoside phosphorylase [Flavobacteriaceae bacterium]|jgi:uridine phosphorylase|nr:nucleoside phosphorylase [Flavobacteriaceae bacterium]MDC1371183.1 nucleoside phosphorylase [Flavobacteriaceae bacterium]
MLNQNESELIFNDDGSVYHLKLKPSNIAGSIILVGDPQRVELISKHFQSIEFSVTNREFKTITGIYKNKRISVISTGIGSGNIDIVLNELDSLVNIDFKTRKLKPKLTKLNLIRIGTSGAIQKDIPIDSLLISSKGIDIDGFLNNYKISNNHTYNEVNNYLNDYKFNNRKLFPLCFNCSDSLFEHFKSVSDFTGVTVTCNGFYGSQGRSLRIETSNQDFISEIKKISFTNDRITNLEMETAIIYGMSKILGHNAISLNAILANRENGTYSEEPNKTINRLILQTLDKLSNL